MRSAATTRGLRSGLLGQVFGNPIGLAAGFDKDAVALAPLANLGFGFVEAGTVTPRAQAGNPRPRLFRLSEDRAVINRMGFNNAGVAAFAARLAATRAGVPVGANLGINKEGARPERDYPALVGAVSDHAAYVVLNVSSPNTPGLRDLQGEALLRGILGAVAREAPGHPPLLVKLAPDLADAALSGIVETCIDGGAAGLIVSNTTTARPASLRSRHAHESGGLSGAPLLARSTAMLHEVARLARSRLVLVGVGGVRTGADVLAKLCAGASLVQVYSEFAYAGPALLPRLKRELLAGLAARAIPTVADAVGHDHRS